MVICGISFEQKSLKYLQEKGIKDSKELKASQRKELDGYLRKTAEKVEIIEFKAQKITSMQKRNTNLNQIEEIGFSKILNHLNVKKAFIDAASTNVEKFSKNLRKKTNGKAKIIAEHKADENRLPVSAASIIAKVRRDKRIEELKEKFGKIGSGYPSDPKTIKFLENWIKNHEKFPKIVRKTWKTAERIKSEG